MALSLVRWRSALVFLCLWEQAFSAAAAAGAASRRGALRFVRGAGGGAAAVALAPDPAILEACEQEIDASKDGVGNCSGAVCSTRRRVDVEPKAEDDYGDLHMQVGGRCCVPAACGSDAGALGRAARRLWRREQAMSRQDFGGRDRLVAVHLEVDCSKSGGIGVTVDEHGKAEVLKARSLDETPAAKLERAKSAASVLPRTAPLALLPLALLALRALDVDLA